MWQEQHTTETAERTATEHWRLRLTAAVMAAWREGAHDAAHEARVLQAACRYWRQALGAAAMRSWAEAAAEMRRKRTVMAAAVSSLRFRLQSAALHGWMERLVERRAKTSAVSQCLQTMASFRQRAAFTAWQHAVDDAIAGRDRMHAVCSHMLHARLAAAWRGWNETATSLRAKREQLATSVRSMVMFKHRAVMNEWQAFVAARVARKQRAQTICCRMLNTQLAAAMQGWRHNAEHSHAKREELAACVRSLLLFRQRAAFSTWQTFCAAEADCKTRLRTICCHMQNVRLASAMSAWSGNARRLRAKRELLANCLRVMTLRQQRRAFSAWRDKLVLAIEGRAQLQAACGRLQHVKQVLSLSWTRVSDHALDSQTELALKRTWRTPCTWRIPALPLVCMLCWSACLFLGILVPNSVCHGARRLQHGAHGGTGSRLSKA